MAIPTCTTDTSVISALPDTPALTPAQLKAKFDEAGTGIKDYINNTQNSAIVSTINSAVGVVNSALTSYESSNNSRVTTIENNIAQLQGKITSGSATPSGGSDGDIYIQYF